MPPSTIHHPLAQFGCSSAPLSTILSPRCSFGPIRSQSSFASCFYPTTNSGSTAGISLLEIPVQPFPSKAKSIDARRPSVRARGSLLPDYQHSQQNISCKASCREYLVRAAPAPPLRIEELPPSPAAADIWGCKDVDKVSPAVCQQHLALNFPCAGSHFNILRFHFVAHHVSDAPGTTFLRPKVGSRTEAKSKAKLGYDRSWSRGIRQITKGANTLHIPSANESATIYTQYLSRSSTILSKE